MSMAGFREHPGETVVLVAHTSHFEDITEVVRIISARKATSQEKERMSKIISYKLEELTELTDKQIVKLKHLAKRPDNEIDFRHP